MGSNLKTIEESAEAIAQGLPTGYNAGVYERALDELQEREDDRENAYRERNQLVAFLSRLYPSHLALHTDDDWAHDWRTIVCIHAQTPFPNTPDWPLAMAPIAGPRSEILQMAWHIHDSELPLFAHLEMRENDWDEHTAAEKYERLQRLP